MESDDVAEVTPAENYMLHVRFYDGTVGIVQMKELITSSRAGVFAELADQNLFADVGVSLGAVTWATGQDLAPDAMYAELKHSGVWKLVL